MSLKSDIEDREKMVLSMGPNTFQIPLKLYDLNRTRLVDAIRSKTKRNAVIVLQGGNEINHYDTEMRYVFRQESFFMWTFGVTEPGFYGMIEVDSGTATLFAPLPPPEQTAWRGPCYTLDHYIAKYRVNNIHYVDVLFNVLKSLKPSVILTLGGNNSITGMPFLQASIPKKEQFNVNHEILYPVMANLRVFKTVFEFDVMKYVIEVTSYAHKRVMRLAKPGISEYICECEFLNYIYGAAGCRFPSFTCICASGKNSAYLHYGHSAAPNNGIIGDKVICRLGMGASYFGYCADISCTFPTNGKFNPDQKLIYEAVLAAHEIVIHASKPGVSFVDLHILGSRTLLKKLTDAGLLTGDLDEMFNAGLSAVFQPHGVAHFIGLDQFDVGGYLEGCPPRPQQDDSFRALRSARVLEEGMFLAICPGCHFIDHLLDKALNDDRQAKFIEKDVIKRFRGFGAIRIEDNIYIHSTGSKNLTKIPRTVEEVEDWLAGIDDPWKVDNIMLNRISSVRFLA